MKKLFLALFIASAPFVFSEKTKSQMQEQLPQKGSLTLYATSLQDGYEKIIQKRAKLGLDTVAILTDLKGLSQTKSTLNDSTLPADLSAYNVEVFKVLNADDELLGTIKVITPKQDNSINYTPSIPIKKE
jgi:hypothetical protein